jgi:hypothetical protein
MNDDCDTTEEKTVEVCHSLRCFLVQNLREENHRCLKLVLDLREGKVEKELTSGSVSH